MSTLRTLLTLLLLTSPLLSANAMPPSSTMQSSAPMPVLNVNHASASELQTLKGIGPRKANAIIKERQTHGEFIDARDLMRVKGIGAALADTLGQRLNFHRP